MKNGAAFEKSPYPSINVYLHIYMCVCVWLLVYDYLFAEKCKISVKEHLVKNLLDSCGIFQGRCRDCILKCSVTFTEVVADQYLGERVALSRWK